MIAFVILNYNTWEMTLRCVDSISETYKDDYKLYIVDNGSTNDSYHQLKEQYQNRKDVVVIQNENLGYAKGNNVGIRQAIQDGYDIITIVNNDVIFMDECIDRMSAFLRENENAAVVAPYVLSTEGKLRDVPFLKPVTTSDYLLYNTKLSKFASNNSKNQYNERYFLSGESIKNDPIPIYKFSGCCFMAKREMLENVELFDENTFLYYEEDILSNKMSKLGFQAYFLPDAKIVHHHGLTTGKDNLFVDTEMIKSEIYFLSKCYKPNLSVLLFIYLDRAIIPIMKKLKKRYNLSFYDYLAFLSKTWGHFRKYSKLRNDRNIV
ncbi:glycosyltransferase family 2 protein [Neobacillus sp. PS3-12]|uniref:glycosyltransferase family 2 protein n=1 Tax=Neobacillus sp. PS3-12 TaxID=3070677 RepID=UPI0027E04CE2|nr:glycosyltransferase family 2 protein [Neobacillus sp. PS3-12]WML54788.1 glycosyltransferase family 2 protein [Neobacillus sp. PS3-12]